MRIAALCDTSQLNSFHDTAFAVEHQFFGFTEGRTLLYNLQQKTFDLIIIDFDLPGIFGAELVAWIRQTVFSAPPILFLASNRDEADVVGGLNAGADGFVSKPVCMKTLDAYVNALLRRAYPSKDAAKIVFGPYHFFPMAQNVEFEGRLVDLGYAEYQLSMLFFKNLGRLLSREFLHEALWGKTLTKTSRALDTQVSKLRTKLALRENNQYFLTSVYGFGYCLQTINDTSFKPLSNLASRPNIGPLHYTSLY